MKNKLLVVITFMLIVLASVAFASQEVIEVKLNDKYIDFTDEQGNRVEPALINDRTMVPMRKIFEAFGAEVSWNEEIEQVIARTAEKEIALRIGNTDAYVRDLKLEKVQAIELDSAPVIINDRTMVPVRFIAESLDKQVGWDAKNQVVVIIDYDTILNYLQESCSTFFEMTEEQTVEMNTFDMTIDLKGNITYKNPSDSKNNGTVALTGTMNVKKAEDNVEIVGSYKMNHKADFLDGLRDVVTFDIIFDLKNHDMYTKYNDGTWAKELTGLGTAFDAEGFDFEEVIKIPAEELTKDSYEELQYRAAIIKELLGNDKIKKAGTSTKTYTMNWNLENIIPELDLDYVNRNVVSILKEKASLSSTYKDGMNTTNKVNIDFAFEVKDTKEKLTIDISGESKLKSYNKPISIELPETYTDYRKQVQFANFCQEYDRIQTAIQLNYYTLYQKYAINSLSKDVPTHYDIYKEVATGTLSGESTSTEWVEITNLDSDMEYSLVSTLTGKWYLRTNDGKLAYEGFEREAGKYYYTPSVSGDKIVTLFNESIIK
ncbi:MAG: copper amine oxidase N-terminal domain-containing protein [Clostridia bacterium]|nr:copper amine oxidase N-terminal domain-containing protein [Clostridia bacterium]